MTVKFELVGFKGLARDLRKLGPAVVKSVRPAISRSAKRLEGQIRAAAPIHSGELRKSITSKVSRSGLSATVRASARHALPVESGTRYRAATPFFFTTAKARQAAIYAEIDKAVRDGLKGFK